MADDESVALTLPSRRTTIIGVGILVVVALLIWVARAVAGVDDDPRAMRDLAVRDCIKISPRPDKGKGATGGMNITHDKVPCDAAGVVTYVVAEVRDGALTCPNANYLAYWEDSTKKSERLWTACLVPNLAVGSCYEVDNQTKAFVAAACGDNSLFRVESVDDVDDPGRCSGTSEALDFSTPPRTYCVTSLG